MIMVESECIEQSRFFPDPKIPQVQKTNIKRITGTKYVKKMVNKREGKQKGAREESNKTRETSLQR